MTAHRVNKLSKDVGMMKVWGLWRTLIDIIDNKVQTMIGNIEENLSVLEDVLLEGRSNR